MAIQISQLITFLRKTNTCQTLCIFYINYYCIYSDLVIMLNLTAREELFILNRPNCIVLILQNDGGCLYYYTYNDTVIQIKLRYLSTKLVLPPVVS